MRNRLTLLSALVAVALSGAPAHASGCPINTDPNCSSLLPGYWQSPTSPWCPIGGCDWLVVH